MKSDGADNAVTALSALSALSLFIAFAEQQGGRESDELDDSDYLPGPRDPPPHRPPMRWRRQHLRRLRRDDPLERVVRLHCRRRADHSRHEKGAPLLPPGGV